MGLVKSGAYRIHGKFKNKLKESIFDFHPDVEELDSNITFESVFSPPAEKILHLAKI